MISRCILHSRVLTLVLESSIVIVEGVTLALIDKGEKKSFLRACFHLYDSGYTCTVITACRHKLRAFLHRCVCVRVCVSDSSCPIRIISLHRNVLLVVVVLGWPHLRGRFEITTLEEGGKRKKRAVYSLSFQREVFWVNVIFIN